MNGRPNVCVVVATNHDEATRFVRPAADAVQPLVAGRGFDFLHLLDDQATRANLEAALAAQHARPSDVVFAFFSAHGSDQDLWRACNGVRQAVFDEALRDHFDGTILVLCTCLYSGLFSAQLVPPHGPAQAVIAYKPTFLITLCRDVPKPNTAEFTYYQQRFLDAMLEPVRSLAQPNVTVGEAEQRTRQAWEDVSQDCAVDPRLRATCAMNARFLYSEGHTGAMLP